MTLIIDHRDVAELISMPEAIDAVAGAYRSVHDGEAVEAERSNLVVPNGWLRTMSAALLSEGVVGYKEFHRFNGFSRYAYHLFDANDGEQLALIDGRHLTALRTGACGGLAARELSAADASELTVIGSGAEARSQVLAVLAVRPIRRVRVYSRSAERRRAFCDWLAGEMPSVAAEPAEDPSAAIDGADIVVAATNTAGRGVALRGEWLHPGPLLVASIGSTMPDQREIDEQVWARADRVVIDSQDVLSESGDALAAAAAGTLDTAKVETLAELVGGAGEARRDGISLYKSVGSALQDIALAIRIYDNARSRGYTGATIAPFQSVRQVDVPADTIVHYERAAR